MLIRIPIAASGVMRLEPPELISGKALPANGSRLTSTPILITASRKIQRVIPEASHFPKLSGAWLAMVIPRHKSPIYRAMMINAPIKPVSSVITANIESVVATGNPMNLVVDLPMPTPKRPPSLAKR